MMLKKPIILRRPPPNLWFLSGTAVTITSLFILPILIVFSHFLLFEVLLQGGTNIGYNPISNTYINISTHEPIPNTIFYTLYFVNIFQYVGFILILCIFPPYPAPFSMIAYIKASGYKKAVREYELVKKALDIASFSNYASTHRHFQICEYIVSSNCHGWNPQGCVCRRKKRV